MPEIILKGLASGKNISLTYTEAEENLTVLDFLLSLGYPMAYSCRSEGICKKCLFNNDLLGCKFRLKDLKKRGIKEIAISYF